MAIQSVTLVPGSRTANKDAMWRRKYKRTWRVITNDPTDEGPLILGASDPTTGVHVAYIGNSYAPTSANRDYGAFVQSLDAQEENEDGLSWLVTAEYGPYDAGLFGANPVEWPVKVVFKGQMREQIIYYDQAGNPLVNSAGEPWADPVTIDDPRFSLVVTRNESISSFALNTSYTYGGTLNLNAWNGITALWAKMGIIDTGEPTYDSNSQTYYYVVTYPIEINRNGWARKVLDRGFNYVSGGSLLPILVNGQKPDDPQLLDGSGGILAHGGTPVSITSDVVPQVDWSPLALNLSVRLGI
jgi:hypothetical protein